MAHLHSPNDPRHARLFELLRQANKAETTVARVRGFAIRRISAEEAAQIKAVAGKSLARQH